MSLSIDGLISGLNTSDIISQLVAIERRPIDVLQTRVAGEKLKQTAFLDLSARLLSLQTNVSVLGQATTYSATSVTSSNESALMATGTNVSALGSFTFNVARMAQTSQLVSQGYADSDTTAVGAGSFSIETGPASVSRATLLDQLNGGTGVDRGSIKITDRNGTAATIDLSAALNIKDVIDAINAEDTLNVTAFHSGRSLGLIQSDGATASNLKAENVGGDTTATDLGMVINVAASTANGTDIYTLGTALPLSILNDGLGIGSATGDDFQITQRDGSTIDVDVSGTTTVGQVLDAINTDSENTGDLVASVSGGSIVLTDASVGGALSVAALNSSTAASDLGLTATAVGGVLTGDLVLAGINDVLLKNFNGGSGVGNIAGLADFRVTLADGVTTFDVNLDNIKTGFDLHDLIKNQAIAAGGSATFTVNASGLGTVLKDNIGGASNITVTALNGSTAAADIGIEGTGNGAELVGSNAHIKYISEGTRLDSLNSGKGVFAGKIKITDSVGVSTIIDLSQASDVTIGDALTDINGGAAGITATVNGNGDGLLITDTAGGTTLLKVEEVDGGTTAKDLNILGTATATASNFVDGSFEHTLTISATDTLEDVARAINDLGIDVQASIINTGTGPTPHRLSIISKNAGKAGEILVDPGTSPLQMTTTSAAADAVLLFGSNTAVDDPILITSSDNTVSNMVPGLDLTLQSVSNTPVTVTVSQDTTQITGNVSKFVETFNDIISTIDDLTDYNVDTEQAGLLLGNTTLSSIRSRLFGTISSSVTGVPSSLSLLAQVGIRIQPNGSLSFDQSTFNTVLEANFDGMVDLFTQFRPITGTVKLADLKSGRGVEINQSGDDFTIHLRDGNTFDVSLSSALDVQDVLDAINDDDDNAGRITASISSDAKSLVLTDATAGANPLTVTALNSSRAFAGLGFSNPISNSGGVLTGSALNARGAPGIAKQLEALLTSITDASTGSLKAATNGVDKKIDNLNDAIDDLEERVTAKEERLRLQFTQMEIALSESQATLSRLQSQLTALSAQQQ